MFWILKFVCLWVKLFGLSVEIWCLCVIFESGLFWFINCESCDELKNFFIVVEIGFVLIKFCGVILFKLFKDKCLCIVCFICIKLIWNWFFVILFMLWIWWLFKWLILFILLWLLWILMSFFIILMMLLLFNMFEFLFFVMFNEWLNFIWFIVDKL